METYTTPARSYLRTVGSYHDHLGKLVAHKIIDEAIIIDAYGDTATALWRQSPETVETPVV
jgi:hypothetical protein